MPFTGTFDGPNRIITLAAGTTEVVVAQLYSAWKQWVLAGNAQYVPAFTTNGGEPISANLDQGAYYFLQNQDYIAWDGVRTGWRIRPAEEDATVLWIGNLVPADDSRPIGVPTIGAFTSFQLGLQPITQSVDPLAEDMTLIKAATAGRVSISLDDQTITIYAEDNVTVLRTLNVSIDGRERTVT